MAKTKKPAMEAAPTTPAVEQPVIEQQLVQSPETVEQAPEAIEKTETLDKEELAGEPAAAEMVKARVLVACAHGAPDDIIQIDAALAKTLAGVVDTSPEAVAYAESVK